ncbi:MAG TPA: Uma2 family endonuclease [Planctomycetaceae bacterium]|nr:Uma2 family endonuclease [Planctomycetaceae bacterium]
MPTAFAEAETFADLLDELGGISPSRVRLRPTPGRATEKDVIRIEAQENRLFELVDGVLVEKAMGAKESLLATHISYRMLKQLESDDLGVVLGADGMMRLRPRLVRIPDVSFISWDQIPGGEFPSKPIPDLYPDLAVEVLSDSNTPREIERKLAEYFAAGCRLAWIVDPKTKTADVYTAPDECQHLRPTQSLDGGDVLPGFKLSLKELFASTRRRR